MHEPIQVLDHGYVRLIECWGHGDAGFDTEGIYTELPKIDYEVGMIEAARQSTQGSFRGWDQDEKLLKFLHNNKHSTPFEFSGMVIEVRAPIFVFREWHRHRTQCLAPDTMINCVSPRGTTYKRSIKSIYELKHGQIPSIREHRNGFSKAGTPMYRKARRKDNRLTRILPNCQNRTLRVLNESSNQFLTGNMSKVWQSGIKELFLLETTKGTSIRASADHRFLSRDGWIKLKDIRAGDNIAKIGKVALNARPIPPALRQGIGVWTSMMRGRLIKDCDKCYICGQLYQREELILDHVIAVSQNLTMALDERNLKPACIKCSRQKTNSEQPSREGMTGRGIKWEKIKETPKISSEEMTYDIEMSGEHHNYVANSLVVHNSYNEMSARYAPLPDMNYVPTKERCFINSTKNKQAGTIKGAEELYDETHVQWESDLKLLYDQIQSHYEYGLSVGIPKELARIILPVGRYSQMRASTCLRNWLTFLTLRMDPNAQYEIRMFANAVGQIIAKQFPRTWALFNSLRSGK